MKDEDKKRRARDDEDDDEDDGARLGLAKNLQVPDVRRMFGEHNHENMLLKHDTARRPIWICKDSGGPIPTYRIFLETFSPIYKQAYDFLISIAEPICRPNLIHEYQLTPYSLHAAVSTGLETETIINVLDRLAKNHLPKDLYDFIKSNTAAYGKVKLVLQRNRYFVESQFPEVVERLLKDDLIRNSRITRQEDDYIKPTPAQIAGSAASGDASGVNMLEDEDELLDDFGKEKEVHSFEIDIKKVQEVKRRCIELDYPMQEEYDFRNDTANAPFNIDLKPTTLIRPYQEKSLSKMFGDGRARSGIIVLPCGAGKTLVGITATCTVKKNTLVLCTSAVSVEQWKHQYKLWSTVEDKQISRFTSDAKEPFPNPAGLVISTYTMIAYSGKRSKESEKIMEDLAKREWGLMVLDEVHVVPADVFKTVFEKIAAHCKLGLTATLVREDEKIKHLNFLIGPKLYEANWLDLTRAGHIANVQCAEVWCPMTGEFYQEYLGVGDVRKRQLLCIMNPNKFRICQFLIEYHEKRGDKIIVFSDNIYALETYARKLGKPFICGKVSEEERLSILSQFQHNSLFNCFFISKVGDTSIDLPGANVIIQISSHYGSRRQEAQRLGRILRPKAKSQEEYNAFFYSLVSKDTQEMYYSTKRQQFLIDQGYSFKVITELPDMDSYKLLYSTKSEQLDLLHQVLRFDGVISEDLPVDLDEADIVKRRKLAATKKVVSMNKLTGGSDFTYLEYSKVQRHALFKKRDRVVTPSLGKK